MSAHLHPPIHMMDELYLIGHVDLCLRLLIPDSWYELRAVTKSDASDNYSLEYTLSSIANEVLAEYNGKLLPDEYTSPFNPDGMWFEFATAEDLLHFRLAHL